MRKKPMKAMERGLLEDKKVTQRTMLLSGLGGSGKTQLALKFARDHEARCVSD
jgi:DNA helicase TIP49 (TBP-interacting protein)